MIANQRPALRGTTFSQRRGGPMRVCAAPRVRPSEACHLGPPRGASRQACHAGGHAGRATQSRTLREFQRHPARTTARSTSSHRPSWGRPLLWGRLSSLRPASQPAWVPLTDCHSCAQSHPPPSGASRQACHAGGHVGRATQSRPVRELQTPSSPHACALHLKPPLRGGASRQACHAGTSCGASRQACHAGGHAGRATQSRPVREFQRHPARTTARSTSTRPLSSHLRVLCTTSP